MLKKIYNFTENSSLMHVNCRKFLLITLDTFIILFAIYATSRIQENNVFNNIQLIIIFLLFGITFYINTGQYKSITKFTNTNAIYKIIGRNLFLCLIIFAFTYFFYYIPLKVFINIFLIINITSILFRIIIKDFLNSLSKFETKKLPKVLIYGAGNAGVQLANSIKISNNFEILAFIDDSKFLWGRSIYDIKIIAPEKISTINKKIDKVLIAIPSIKRNRRREIVQFLKNKGLNIYQIPSLEEITSGKVKINKIKPVIIEDLLGRDEISSETDLINLNLENKSILITGGGGSIGSELCRKLIKLNPSKLIILDSSEENLYNIESELNNLNFLKVKLFPILGNTLDSHLISNVIKKYKITTIFHAAAYKHVPLVEKNKLVGLYNNVFSTRNICEQALINKVEHMILISSDKAVRPTNIMGASKRLSELIVQSYAKLSEIQSKENQKKVIFSMVRFGNVLGSSGSVIPLFKKQIANGGPITITHPDVCRYFMTIPEAANLVIQTIKLSKGGEVFLLDMGEPVKITKLAEQLIHLSGLTIKNKVKKQGDIEIKYIGLRPGEKLYEELLINSESIPTENPLIYRALEGMIEPDLLFKDLDKLEKELRIFNEKESILLLKNIVKDWKN